jgi:two-component system response regulator
MTASHPVEILLVDDNPSDVELTIHSLRQYRLANAIQVAADGKEALDFLFCRAGYEGRPPAERPRVILLDLKLPKVDGLEVLSAIKSDVRTKAIPVVILTSSKEPKDLIQGYELGASAYVQKPVDFEQFRTMIGGIGTFWLALNESPPPEVFAISKASSVSRSPLRQV